MNLLSRYSPVFAPETGSGSSSAPAASPASPASSPAGASGASSSPASSSAPSVASPLSPAGTPPQANSSIPELSGEAFDFSSIFTNDGDQKAAPEAPVVAAAPVAAPAKVEPKPPVGAEPPKPATVPATAEAPTPGQAAPSSQGTPAQPEARPHLDPADPTSLARALQENESAAITHIAGSMFKLTPEEVEALETNAVEAIPQLLAKGFVKAQQNMLSQMGRMIPQMIQRHGEITKRNADNEGKFFARWTDLKPDVHGDKVRQYAATYRAMHPSATLEQMIEDLGPMVMMAARVTPSTGLGTAPPVAASPMAPTAGRPPQPSPFVPAVGGGGGIPAAEEVQPWEAVFAQQE